MIKLQIACILILIYIAVMYFSSKRALSKLHRSYSMILIAMPVSLIFDGITVYTVNLIPYSIFNDIAHRFFLAGICIVTFLFNRYVGHLVVTTVEERELSGNKLRKVLCIVVLLVTVIYCFVAPADYVIDETLNSNYAAVAFTAGAFVSIIFSELIILYMLVSHWKTISKKMKIAISMVLAIQAFGGFVQMFFTDYLLSSLNLTLMTLSFYLTLDNPDIALLELVEEEKKKIAEISESKSDFLAVISNEIGGPIEDIVSMADAVLEEKERLSDNQKLYLNRIKTSGETLNMIVTDIIDQSGIEEGQITLSPKPYNIRDLIREIIRIIENRIPNKPIEVGCVIDDKIPEMLVGDRNRIRQILVNLMTNPIKYTEKGFIRLSLMLREESYNGYTIKFSVKDSGQGIRPEDLAKIGEAFLDVDMGINHSKESTGLGLTISRDLISMMGGKLFVDSEYGNGTELFFTIEQQKYVDEAKVF